MILEKLLIPTYTHPTHTNRDLSMPLKDKEKDLFGFLEIKAGKRRKASVTVEASLAVPIFFFALVALFYLFEILSIQVAVHSGLQYAGKIWAQEAYSSAFLNKTELKNNVISAVGDERLDRSVILGGSSGLDLGRSRVSASKVATLAVEYKIKLPVPMFHISPLTYSASMKVKGWTGYENTGLQTDENIVYVTDTGVVYHKDYHCKYLDVTVVMIPTKNIAEKRNKDGAKYYPWEYCGKRTGSACYVTAYGNRYHSSVSCGELKRTVYSIPISEAVGKRPCSKCG